MAPSLGEPMTTAVVELAVPGAALPPGAPLPVALLPEVEPEPELDGELPPVVVVPGTGLLLVVGALPAAGVRLVEVPAELVYPPEPPHPTIAATRIKEDANTPCRIRPPRNGNQPQLCQSHLGKLWMHQLWRY